MPVQNNATLRSYFNTNDVPTEGQFGDLIDSTLNAEAYIFQNIKTSNYTLVSTDAQKHIFHPSSDTTARTWTIPSNEDVSFPIGTAITFINQNSAGVITIAISLNTMRLAGA